MVNASIVIPVHNALKCVDSLLHTIDKVTPPTDIVLVDDASDSDTRKRLDIFSGYRPVISNTVLLHNQRQQLFTRTVNRGIRYAVQNWNPDVVVVINTDCALQRGWYDHLLRMFECPYVGITGYRDDQEPREAKYTEVKIPNYVTGHCFALRVCMLREVGVLCETDIDGRQDKSLAPYKGQAHIGSERILCNKANIHGWKTLYCNGLYVQHEDGKSWGRDLRWLNQFILEPLWEPNDTLEPERFYG